jgi:hypothetical protein
MTVARLVVVGFTLTAIACGGSTNSPSPAVNLTGTWSGRVGEPMSGSALRLTWMAMQEGDEVSGPATVLKPSADAGATGTMSGTLSGSQLTLRYSVPAGSVPVYLSCTVNGSGDAAVTDHSIAGTLDLTFTGCLGSGLATTDSAQLELARQ